MKAGIKWQFLRNEQVNVLKVTEDPTGKQLLKVWLNAQTAIIWL